MAYAPAYEAQSRHAAEVLASRDAAAPEAGRLLLVEHDPPVITVPRRPGARRHLIAGEGELNRAGVQVVETDRGGDITYHGPGQLVAYPILDLNHLVLGLHAYMRLLEQCAIDVCEACGVAGERQTGCTGVWARCGGESAGEPAKICAIGVRVRRWVSMHGLALNVSTNLDHFGFIVPCGLAGRSVTSLAKELGDRRPTMAKVKRLLVEAFEARLASAPRA